METSRDIALAVYCSYGPSYASFASTSRAVRMDVRRLLIEFEAPAAARDAALAALAGSPDYAAGVRHEAGKDAERSVLYATHNISPIDDGKKALEDVLAGRLKESASKKAAWRAA